MIGSNEEKFVGNAGPVSGDGGGGTPDNTTAGHIPFKKDGAFENAPLTVDETAGEIIASVPIRASVIAPTGSYAFEDATVLSTNTDSLEIEDCIRNDRHEIVTSVYSDAGSEAPYFTDKEALGVVDIQILDDAQSGLFEFTALTQNDLHWKDIITIPRAAGPAVFVVKDTNENGCFMVTETKYTFTVGEIGTEVPIRLLNRVKVYTGQTVWVSYVGAPVAGHVYSGNPVFSDGFIPVLKIQGQRFVDRTIPAEAPTDGKQYGRQSSGWTEIVHSGHYLGVYADLAALQVAHPTSRSGDTATVIDPNANLFYWSGSSWEDSGTGYIGDMLKAIYDPTNVGSDAFDMGSMVESLTEKILTSDERINLGNQSGTNTGDQDLSGLVTAAQVNNTTGYANYLDSSTSSVPRTYATDTELPLINDKAFPDGARYPDGITSYWDAVGSKFAPDQADGSYAFSVNFNVDPVERDKRLIVKFISYDAGGPGVDELIQERLVRLQKDAGEITPVSLSFTRGVTAAIVTNGVSVTLEFQGTAAEVYDITCGLAKVGADVV